MGKKNISDHIHKEHAADFEAVKGGGCTWPGSDGALIMGTFEEGLKNAEVYGDLDKFITDLHESFHHPLILDE